MKKYYALLIMGLMLFSYSEKLRAQGICSYGCQMGTKSCNYLCHFSFGQQHKFCDEICDSFRDACSPNHNDCRTACHDGVEECFATCEHHTKLGYMDCHMMCDSAYSACLAEHVSKSQQPSPAQKNTVPKKQAPHTWNPLKGVSSGRSKGCCSYKHRIPSSTAIFKSGGSRRGVSPYPAQ